MEHRDEVWVNVLFKGPEWAEFRQVQEHLGIKTRTDVVRHLVREKARQIDCAEWVRDGSAAETP